MTTFRDPIKESVGAQIIKKDINRPLELLTGLDIDLDMILHFRNLQKYVGTPEFVEQRGLGLGRLILVVNRMP